MSQDPPCSAIIFEIRQTGEERARKIAVNAVTIAFHFGQPTPNTLQFCVVTTPRTGAAGPLWWVIQSFHGHDFFDWHLILVKGK
mmetsp:Transcript_30939/g.55575  ORF Transcript_30939/g.55575 Transcript_30939/m.55575 type:complete len:84 (+) Transcript_30939:468-719(+)